MLPFTPSKGQPLGWIGLFLLFFLFFGVVTCANLTSMTIAALFPFLRVRTTSKTRGERIIVPSLFPPCGPRRHATSNKSYMSSCKQLKQTSWRMYTSLRTFHPKPLSEQSAGTDPIDGFYVHVLIDILFHFPQVRLLPSLR